MYNGTANPYIFVEVVGDDGTDNTSFNASASGLSGKLVFDDGTEITISSFADSATHGKGNIYQPVANSNFYRIGIANSDITGKTGKFRFVGRYATGNVKGFPETLTAIDPAQQPSTHDAQDVRDYIHANAITVDVSAGAVTSIQSGLALEATSQLILEDTGTTLPALLNAMDVGATRVHLSHSPALEIPDSGAVTMKIKILTYTDGGVLADADSTPTLTVTGASSGSLAANLSAVSNIATGEYEATYTLDSADPVEAVDVRVSATLSGQAYVWSSGFQITDAVAVDFTETDRTTLGAISGLIGALNDLSLAEVTGMVQTELGNLEDVSLADIRTQVDASNAAATTVSTADRDNLLARTLTASEEVQKIPRQSSTVAAGGVSVFTITGGNSAEISWVAA